MIDWEYAFNEWLEQRKQIAKSNDFDYVIVHIDVPAGQEFEVNVRSSFYKRYPDQYREREDVIIYEVEDQDDD